MIITSRSSLKKETHSSQKVELENTALGTLRLRIYIKLSYSALYPLFFWTTYYWKIISKNEKADEGEKEVRRENQFTEILVCYIIRLDAN